MSDPGDDTPEGFLFDLPPELAKAAPSSAPTNVLPVAPPSAAQEAELLKAARAVAAPAPARPQHGRPAGAGNALAFHTWQRDPSTNPGDAPKKDDPG
jgi:hypothetical protein